MNQPAMTDATPRLLIIDDDAIESSQLRIETDRTRA